MCLGERRQLRGSQGVRETRTEAGESQGSRPGGTGPGQVGQSEAGPQRLQHGSLPHLEHRPIQSNAPLQPDLKATQPTQPRDFSVVRVRLGLFKGDLLHHQVVSESPIFDITSGSVHPDVCWINKPPSLPSGL